MKENLLDIQRIREISSQMGIDQLSTMEARADASSLAFINIVNQFGDISKVAEMYAQFSHFRAIIFGSARIKKSTSEFQFVENLAKSIALKAKADMVTGGGPGVMEAANRGLMRAHEEEAKKGKGKLKRKLGRNHGVRVHLDFEQGANAYVHPECNILHQGFLTRLQHFMNIGHGLYLAPGGYGSDLERALALQLKQVHHIDSDFPVIAHSFWKPIMDALNDTMYHQRIDNGVVPLVSEKDLQLVQFSDNIDEITAVFVEQRKKWKEWKRWVKPLLLKGE